VATRLPMVWWVVDSLRVCHGLPERDVMASAGGPGYQRLCTHFDRRYAVMAAWQLTQLHHEEGLV